MIEMFVLFPSALAQGINVFHMTNKGMANYMCTCDHGMTCAILVQQERFKQGGFEQSDRTVIKVSESTNICSKIIVLIR